MVREGAESRNCIAGRFPLNDLLPVRFRKLGIVSSSLLSPPPSATVTVLQSPLPHESQREDCRVDAGKTSLVSFQLSATRKQYPLRTCTMIRNDITATDIGCYRLKASRNFPFYATCQSLFLHFISIALNRLKKTALVFILFSHFPRRIDQIFTSLPYQPSNFIPRCPFLHIYFRLMN